jgi:serine/threonine protein kinase
MLKLRVGQTVRARFGDYYRVAQPIGYGKNATAYLTLQTSGVNAGNFCSLKVLQDPYNEPNRRKFETEIATLTRLRHSSILQIVDSGESVRGDSVYPFYLSDYYQETLADALNRGLSFPSKLAFALQMISGLAYLASHDIVHCDLKPDNIFIRGFDCAIADFGLVRLPSATGEGSLGPSLHRYRTPDIAAFSNGGEPPSTKSDVFQMGLVLAEIFTGTNICREAPNGGDQVELDPLPEIHGSIGNGISNVLNEMLDFDASKRPDAEALRDRWQGLLFTVIEHRWIQEDRIF